MNPSGKEKNILKPRSKDINKILRKCVSLLSGEIGEFRNAGFSRILFIYNPDLAASRARILPMKFNDTCLGVSMDRKRTRPSVRINGKQILYIIEYGDAFLKASREKKLQTLIHELLHCSPFFNGTLSRNHRHENYGKIKYSKTVKRIACAISESVKFRLLDLLSLHGDVEIQTWKSPFSLLKFSRRSENDLRNVTIFND